MKKRLQRIERALKEECFGGYIVFLPLEDGYIMVNGETMTQAEWQERQRARRRGH